MDVKKKRYFHRISTGQKLARLRRKTIRFITLTTSDIGKQNDLSRDVDVLIKRRRRKDKTFEYFKITTNEGNGVVHMLYTGKFVTYGWLKYNWNKIHNSYIVDIRKVRDDLPVANYLINQYLSNQKCSYTYMSYSKKWMFPGAVQRWKNIIKAVKSQYYYNTIQNKYYKHKKEVSFKEILNKILSIWNTVLYWQAYKQTYLTDYG